MQVLLNLYRKLDMTSHIVKDIIKRHLKIDKIEIDKNNFNFRSLNANEWSVLLTHDYDRFSSCISHLDKNPVVKAHIIISSKTDKVRDGVRLESHELQSLPGYLYRDLLISEGFEKYYDHDAYSSLSKSYQNDVFCHNPDKIYKIMGKFPTMSRWAFQSVSMNNPKFIVDHIDSLKDKLLTSDSFWINMIKKSPGSFKKLFVEKLNTIDSKSSIRTVIREYPDILKLITVDTISEPHLTKKEWLHFIKEIISTPKTAKKLGDWTIPDDIMTELEFGVTTEVLSGKSTLSKQLKNSLAKLKTKTVQDSESEITDQDGNSV